MAFSRLYQSRCKSCQSLYQTSQVVPHRVHLQRQKVSRMPLEGGEMKTEQGFQLTYNFVNLPLYSPHVSKPIPIQPKFTQVHGRFNIQRVQSENVIEKDTVKNLRTFFEQVIEREKPSPQKGKPNQPIKPKLPENLQEKLKKESPSETSPLYSLVKELEPDFQKELTNTPEYVDMSDVKDLYSGYYVESETDKKVKQLTPEELALFELTSKKLRELSPEEQSKYGLKTDKEDQEEQDKNSPIFFWRGKPYHTKQMKAMKSDQGERSIFVMTTDGKIYSADQSAETRGTFQGETHAFHHSTFLRGQPVAMAGELIFDNGVLVGITNSSGHYKPGVKHTQQVLTEFKRRGVDLAGVQVIVVGLLHKQVVGVFANILSDFKGDPENLVSWLRENKQEDTDYQILSDQEYQEIKFF